MTRNSRNSLLTILILACLSVAATAVLVCCSERAPEKKLTGPEMFLRNCGTQGKPDADCLSLDGIQKAFGFDVMAEIKARQDVMQKTAKEIAAGKLTDEAYEACLKDGSCAKVPMLDEKMAVGTPHAKEISRAFWDLAEGHGLTLAVCKTMQLCAVALENGVLVAKKNKVSAAKVRTP